MMTIFAIISLITVAILPFVADADLRKTWWERLTTCRWRAVNSSTETSDTAASTTGRGGVHYILSPQQEQEIRQGVLEEQLRNYSMVCVRKENDGIK